MKVAVPRESAPGEHRGRPRPRRRRSARRRGLHDRGRAGSRRRGGVHGRRIRRRGGAGGRARPAARRCRGGRPRRQADRRRGRGLAPGTVLIGFLAPLTDAAGIERLAARGVGRLRDGVDPENHAGAVDGRLLEAPSRACKAAVLAADRLPRLFPLLMTAAGTIAPQGARARRRRRGAAGDRDDAPARRGRLRLRRPAGRARAGREHGSDLPRPRRRRRETSGGYAAELTPEEQKQQQAPRGAHSRVRRRDHDRARSPAARRRT